MQYLLSAHDLREFAGEVAGMSSVPFMKESPSIVMPTEELLAGVDALLEQRFGIKPSYEVKEKVGAEVVETPMFEDLKKEGYDDPSN